MWRFNHWKSYLSKNWQYFWHQLPRQARSQRYTSFSIQWGLLLKRNIILGTCIAKKTITKSCETDPESRFDSNQTRPTEPCKYQTFLWRTISKSTYFPLRRKDWNLWNQRDMLTNKFHGFFLSENWLFSGKIHHCAANFDDIVVLCKNGVCQNISEEYNCHGFKTKYQDILSANEGYKFSLN